MEPGDEAPPAISERFYCRLDSVEEKRSALSERSEFADRPVRILAAVKSFSVAGDASSPGSIYRRLSTRAIKTLQSVTLQFVVQRLSCNTQTTGSFALVSVSGP